jgi:NAD(P)-dependent dehydrogenase (short-subunit alcohol dehydrogenase family)
MADLFADLEGKAALVTGASGGLGAHFARTLVSHGVKVALAARRKEALEALAAELTAQGGQALAVQLDVTNATSVREALTTAQRSFGAIDILVNNSGVSANAPVLEQTESDWDRVFDTNTKGAFLMSSELARQLRAAGKPGSIINIASVLGLRQASHVAPYAASKAALVQLTKTLALELARYQIRVNALAPGYILTDLNREFFATEEGAKMIRRIPQRRLGHAEDLDGPLLLLASDASRFMTGAVIPVDGGHLVTSL